MAHIYVDKNRRKLTVKEFDELSRNTEYSTVREFENDRLYAKVAWNGIVHDSRTVPQDQWKIYELVVLNIVTTDPEGNPLEQPKRVRDPELCARFVTETQAIDAFEAALVKYGGCKGEVVKVEGYSDREAVVGFQEVGNKLLPPSKDRPHDAPSSKVEPAEFGSW